MKPIQLNDFLAHRYISGLTYAPDGTRAAFVLSQADEKTNDYRSFLYLYDGEIRQLTSLGRESSFVWLDDRHLLFPAARSDEEKKKKEEGNPSTFYYCLDLRGGEALPAFSLPFPVHSVTVLDENHLAVIGAYDKNCPDFYRMTEEEQAEVLGKKKDEKDYEVLDELPFWGNGEGFTNGQRSALFLVELNPFRITRVSGADETVSLARLLGDEVLYAVGDCPAKASLHGMKLRAFNWKTAQDRTVFYDPELMLENVLVDNTTILLLAARGDRYGCNENPYVYRLNPSDGTLMLLRAESMAMHGDVGSDVRFGSNTEQAVRSGDLYYVAGREGNAELYVTHPDGSSEPVLTKDGSIDGLALSEHHETILLVAMYDMGLQELYAFDLHTHALNRLSHFNDACLEDRYVAQPLPLSVSSCGLDIGGWVLLPMDYDPGKTYPAILDIHGGPKCVYGPVYYHEMQLWASMGYFVFFCNPKGGDGRDNEFADIRGDYGGTDYLNLMDFTDAVLRAYPQIDVSRLCVTGGSYGGFMTNWIIGHTNRFCCAASQRSISNWLSFYGVSDIGAFFASDQNAASLYESPEKLWAHSPLKYAAHVCTPTLFIHSDEDYRCPLEQGIQMYSALVDRGIEARMCLFHGENHELSRSGKPLHRIRRLTEMTNWFETHTHRN